MKRFYTVSYLLCGICLLWMTGCSNMLDETRPKDKTPRDVLSESDLVKLSNGVYVEMEKLAFRLYMDGDVKRGNFKAGPGFSMNDPMSMAPSSKNVLGQWRECFAALKQVSFLVETYGVSFNKDSRVVKQTGGAGYYSQALVYYHLVTRRGGAPTLRKRTYDVASISPETDVRNPIKEDLDKVESLLPEFTDRSYIPLSICDTLNTKVCLALKDYTDAVIYADRAVTKSNFALSTTSVEYANAFISNSNSGKPIFTLANKRSTGLLLLYQSANDIDPTWNYSSSVDCYSRLYTDTSVKKQDIHVKAVFRADNGRIIKPPNGGTGQFVTNEQSSQAPIVVACITEMYPIRVEALGVTNSLSTLKEFMNKCYTTVSLPSSMSDTEFQSQILDEHHRELYTEGQRWYGLKRTNRLGLFTLLNGRNYLIYYPVSRSERDLAEAENYSQNDGY